MPAPVTGAVTTAAGGGIQIRFVPPLEFLARAAGAFGAQLRILSELWDRFEPIMRSIEEEQFSSRGHGQWPPLAASTLKSKRGPAIMVETGALKGSLTAGWMTAGAQSAVWGTDVPYAHWHQDGGSVPGRPPQRKLIDIRPEERQRFEQEMVSWINDVARRTFAIAA